ncbi:hypothetical protein V5F89_10890 [Pelagerythrobacter marensis]|uniref:Uncharacterized protein n=1 Tax=Pelagerythrobacter marensis TaxID=543877 RepID=A0ABZ2D625_9SPHN
MSYTYDAPGRMTRIDRANSRATVVTHGPLSRPSRLNHSGLVYYDFTYNPAGQVLTRTISNDAYVLGKAYHVNTDRDYAVNNLNQYTTAGPAVFAYDNSGNLISDGANSYSYDPENRMTGVTLAGTAAAALRYDGLGRLNRTSGDHSRRPQAGLHQDGIGVGYQDKRDSGRSQPEVSRQTPAPSNVVRSSVTNSDYFLNGGRNLRLRR